MATGDEFIKSLPKVVNRGTRLAIYLRKSE